MRGIEFRGKKHLMANPRYRLPGNFFAMPTSVEFRSVDEIHSELDTSAQHANAVAVPLYISGGQRACPGGALPDGRQKNARPAKLFAVHFSAALPAG